MTLKKLRAGWSCVKNVIKGNHVHAPSPLEGLSPLLPCRHVLGGCRPKLCSYPVPSTGQLCIVDRLVLEEAHREGRGRVRDVHSS